MKLGIIGGTNAGKATIFSALTCNDLVLENKNENKLETVTVPDLRVNTLSEMYKPKKTTYAQVSFYYPGVESKDKGRESGIWTRVRECDAIIHVVRNFGAYGMDAPDPLVDFEKLDQELIISDLMVAEKRLDKLEMEGKKGKHVDPTELALLKECKDVLENEIPIRRKPKLATAPKLKGFTFLSAKPTLVLFNNGDEDDLVPDLPSNFSEDWMVIRGKIEQEISLMSPADAREFLSDYGIDESIRHRLIKRAYELLGLISFFTVGEDEVKAWTILKDTQAVDAANVIHSDIKKGFIRAEVVSYDDLIDAGSNAEAKKRGRFRLEGKTYTVQNGDIINFRFNV